MNEMFNFKSIISQIDFHKIIKVLIFISCFIISVYLMIQLTTSLSLNPDTKNKMIFVAIVVEAAAMFAFLRAKQLWKKGKWEWGKSKNKVIAILLFFIYVMYVTMAVNSAIGYFNMESNQQSTIAQQIIKIDKRNEREYNQNAKQIDFYQKQYEKETDKYGKKSKEIEIKIENLQLAQEKLKKDLNKVEKTTDNLPKDVLFYLNKVYGIPKNIISIIIFGMIAFIAFAGQIITAPDLPDDKEKKTTSKDDESQLSPLQQKMIMYVMALFDGCKAYGMPDDERLNGNSVISEKTGISKEECEQMRDILKNLRINGNGMALKVPGKGGTYSNYPKEKIINYIKTHDIDILF